MNDAELDLLLAGPIVRKTTAETLHVWFALSENQTIDMELSIPQDYRVKQHTYTIAQKIYCSLVEVTLAEPMKHGQWVSYDAIFTDAKGTVRRCTEIAPHLCYEGQKQMGFAYHHRLTNILHGSCRKPHQPCDDGMLRIDQLLSDATPETWPSLLIHSGDQVYVDDVAGPMVEAIHQVIPALGFANEMLPGCDIPDSDTLHRQAPHLYQREQLLPDDADGQQAAQFLFKGTKKPIFTSVNARNHLISFAEMMTLYLLVWSPSLWKKITLSETTPDTVPVSENDRYQEELKKIQAFSEQLHQCQRVLAHLPNAMIFDDHDVTDDWNLTAEWEMAAYQQPLSKRIIGNALFAYFFTQGWGNAPEHFDTDWHQSTQHALDGLGSKQYDQWLDSVLAFDHWQFQWPTQPPLIVLDTRTQRWRSERSPSRPSGLMDWESLSQLQQLLLHQESVVLVSAAPIFGVKLIEAIQKFFTIIGKPLVVDAENWMAHNGTATTLMNMFNHKFTPKHFIILSGDVHYSFVYDVRLRDHEHSPTLWQITSSGVKNSFPEPLLSRLDTLNRWLYSPKSPLNLFTKRHAFSVEPRKPSQRRKGQRLVNGSGIGLVVLNEDGSPQRIAQLMTTSDIDFEANSTK